MGHMKLFPFSCRNIVVDHPVPLRSGPICLAIINLIMRRNIAHCKLLEVIRENYLRYAIASLSIWITVTSSIPGSSGLQSCFLLCGLKSVLCMWNIKIANREIVREKKCFLQLVSPCKETPGALLMN
jgi:hypothetical protein